MPKTIVHTFTRDIIYDYSNQFYVVFINNLTDAMIQVLHEGLQDFAPYSGLADITYSSGFKSYLSVILPSYCIQYRNTIICAHEDDLPDSDYAYLAGYPFEDFGYVVRSVPRTLQDVLLSYKIEMPAIRGFDEVDIDLSLNAVTLNPLPLEHYNLRAACRDNQPLIGKNGYAV